MEESMQGSFDKRRQDPQSNYRSFSIKLIALPVLVIVALIGMLVSRPAAVKWISDAAQAEFAGTNAIDADPVPSIAQPAPAARSGNEIRTVKAY
ncbi:hypothetical protein HAP48_0047835 [Bradyrhizobium septentrionale]|uniref:Uncharacterized protein n=1 Tax=Bradyrhizobium septentrionale TaxID=1404411 RepID=A0A974A3P3_9BRAD|nr:hypothetical protein [Bradyrhizobium septentrionale]UGY16114.1 hypothetical protein HAP48_0047835 [Bradyrhizobium septentrionale]UGY24751.1 hypothetical protein HU675_0043830 [Bradyrhizobium septentrionale]